MFTKVKGVNYSLNKEIADELYTEARTYLTNETGPFDTGIVDNTIKLMISHRVASLVFDSLKNVLIKSGYITVQVNTTLSFAMTVAYVNDEVAYGVLVK